MKENVNVQLDTLENFAKMQTLAMMLNVSMEEDARMVAANVQQTLEDPNVKFMTL